MGVTHHDISRMSAKECILMAGLCQERISCGILDMPEGEDRDSLLALCLDLDAFITQALRAFPQDGPVWRECSD